VVQHTFAVFSGDAKLEPRDTLPKKVTDIAGRMQSMVTGAERLSLLLSCKSIRKYVILQHRVETTMTLRIEWLELVLQSELPERCWFS